MYTESEDPVTIVPKYSVGRERRGDQNGIHEVAMGKVSKG